MTTPDYTTCGTCGRTWDDAIITGMTPAPSARCPFEDFHDGRPIPEDYPVRAVRGRTCGECGKAIYYGLFCSNYCSNLNYQRWLRIQARRGRERCGCKSCAIVTYPEERNA